MYNSVRYYTQKHYKFSRFFRNIINYHIGICMLITFHQILPSKIPI